MPYCVLGLGSNSANASSIQTDEKIPQKDIAAISRVSQVTIRNRLNDLKKTLECTS